MGTHGETADVLAELGRTAEVDGELARALELLERAYAAYRREERAEEAADTALRVAFLHATVHGELAVARGWLARAERLLEGREDCAARGWVTLFRAPFSRDPAERGGLAESALATARRFRDTDLEFEALALLGETRVASGRIADGMRLLDEAMAAVSCGEVTSPTAAGDISCRLLSACEQAADVRRAEQWLAQIERRVAWRSFVRPTCRTHYGGILTALGRWAEAESELVAALRGFDEGYRAERVYPQARLADLRVRQGRLEEAELLLDGVEWHPLARRARAMIALARGEYERAAEHTRLCLDDSAPADVSCVPLLALLVEVELIRGDRAAATRALERLAPWRRGGADAWAEAFAHLAEGRVEATQDAASAIEHLKRAVASFATLDLPLEAARAQLALAEALAVDAPYAAIDEAQLALAAFERLGAARDADTAAGLLRRLGTTGRARPRRPGALTTREREVLALLGAGLSNAQIAERLVISPRTAEHHVASILAKLGLRSRSAAAAYAVRSGAEDP